MHSGHTSVLDQQVNFSDMNTKHYYHICCLAFLLLPLSCYSVMIWKRLDNPEAVCNDFSRAGYFMEQTGSNKWIIFLEGGGLCYSPESCNRRFFRPEIRREFAKATSSLFDQIFPEFNFTMAWTSTESRLLSQRINIYMTSMETYMNDSNPFTIEGRDILDADPIKNPPFHDYNHVVIPYCSSDLWLGNDSRSFPDINTSSSDPQQQFLQAVYQPENSILQFTFRGKIIVRSVINELIDLNGGLLNGSDIIIAGSSAGGVGAVNIAKWIHDILPQSVNLSIITDSSWFINFRGNVYRRINGTVGDIFRDDPSDPNSLLSIIESSPECLDVSFGSPCCVLLECMLANPEYFPVNDVPIISLLSLYDVYLLAEAISNVVPIGDEGSSYSQSDIGFDFIFTVAEYGGAMNSSLAHTISKVSSFSYIVTECLQHIYLATSTLWGKNSLLQSDSRETLNIDLGTFESSFSHTIESNVWTSYAFNGRPVTSRQNSYQDSCTPSDSMTIQEALHMWKNCRNTVKHLEFHDTCYSIHCNSLCPDKVNFRTTETQSLPFWINIFLIVIVVAITTVSILSKVLFMIWELTLNRKQSLYLQRVYKRQTKNTLQLITNKEIPQFPSLELEDAVSVSCVDVFYSVKVQQHMTKDENDDNSMVAMALSDTIDDESVNEEEIQSSFISRTLSKETQENDVAKGIFNDRNKFEIAPRTCGCSRIEKDILKGVTAYFNPGELVGIMGPSGCGKTTLLDLLTGRRRTGNFKGDIFINGAPLNTVRDRYVCETGYVLQLATPYYEELTVRENLTLSAHMKLPSSMPWKEIFERVEQVIEISGLLSLEDTKVGGLTGPGLSGGQKKRLMVALQLLTMPKVIFLDEPTSGLDATASVELLTHLNDLAFTNRTVVLTIHQPRFEIFYMFNKLILLSDGKIAYSGVPQKAYGFFVEAVMSKFFDHGMLLPELENQNPADVIMDMLGKQWIREIILEQYQCSSEPETIKLAIHKARINDVSSNSNITNNMLIFDDYTGKGVSTAANIFNHMSKWFSRLAVLEARARKRSSLTWTFYLPVIFFAYGVLLGTVYFQQDQGFLIISGYCVYSVASALFMFPALQNYYLKALEIHGYEKADGAGLASDLIIQGFTRFVTKAIIPVIICALILYLLLVKMEFWSAEVFFQLVVVGMALNQTWISLLIFVICTFPSYAHRLSPIISSVAGFTSGFFIPREATPWLYRWLFYINPNYYGFSASAHLILADFKIDCESGISSIICYFDSGDFILKKFNFDDVKPYLNIAILLLMSAIYLSMAIFANWLKHTNVFSILKSKIKLHNEKKELEHLKTDSNLQDTGHHQVNQNNWIRIASKALKQEQEINASKVSTEFGDEKKTRDVFQASLTEDGEDHVVFRPGGITNNSTPQFAKLVFNLMQQRDQQKGTPPFKQSLKDRQLDFKDHIKTTQEVIKEQTKEYVEFDEMDEEERKAHLRSIMAKVSARLQEKGKQQATAANVFSDALNKLGKKTPLQRDDTTSIESMASSWRAKAKKSKPSANPYVIAMSVNKFKNMKKVVEEERQQVPQSSQSLPSIPEDYQLQLPEDYQLQLPLPSHI